MIKLKLPGIGIVCYHYEAPPKRIYDEDLIGNVDYDSLLEVGGWDYEYTHCEHCKYFMLKGE